MNQLTKEELETIASCVSIYAKDEPDDYLPLFDKLCGLINNYCDHDVMWIAKSHLDEALSLISHARCLLGFDNDDTQ